MNHHFHYFLPEGGMHCCCSFCRGNPSVICKRGFGVSTLVFSSNGDVTLIFLTLHFYPHFFNMKGDSTPRLLSTTNSVNFYAKEQVYPQLLPSLYLHGHVGPRGQHGPSRVKAGQRLDPGRGRAPGAAPRARRATRRRRRGERRRGQARSEQGGRRAHDVF